MGKKLPFSMIVWRSRRTFLGVLLVLLLSPISFFIMDQAKVIIEDLSETNRLKNQKDNEKRVKGYVYEMPKLNPFAENFPKTTEHLPIVTCNGTDWVNCYKSECNVTEAILKSWKNVVCVYRDIIYVDDSNVKIGHPTKVKGNETYSLRKSDHVKIDCVGNAIKSPDVHAYWSGLKTGFRPIPTVAIPPHRNDSFNVMILCFDSTSRNEFIRIMPKTFNYLMQQLNPVFLNSYNIVGDGPAGALYPILTGKSEEEHIYQRKWTTRKKYIDSKKFIFHMLKEYGYRTAYFEDMPLEGTYHHGFNWFRSQPADHYLRALLLANISQGEDLHRSPTRPCYPAVPQYQVIMNLADEFLQLVGKKFCFALVADLSYKNLTVVPTADEALLTFLHTLYARKALEDTLVLIMGDHGSRFSTTRDYFQGRIEERLPLMAILLPEKLKNLRPAALTSLKNNVDVLTTPFDIHKTILDVLDLKKKSNTYKIPGSDLPRAMSLLEPIPRSRSCGEAGVMPHWCACQQWSDVPRFSPKYTQVGYLLAKYINSISKEQRSKCAKRNLLSTQWVKQQNATDLLSKANYFDLKQLNHQHRNKAALRTLDQFYQAKIIMSPGRSVFEGTITYNPSSEYYVITQKDISRVNPNGDESKCISATHPHLIKFCYCRKTFVKSKKSKKK